MQRANTRGKSQANKCMLMAATAFNIKKLLKYGKMTRNTLAQLEELPMMTIESLKPSF